MARCLLFAVALDALLHLFVDLAQRQATWAFQFVGIGIGVVFHGNGLFRMSRLDLDTDGQSRQARGSSLPAGV